MNIEISPEVKKLAKLFLDTCPIHRLREYERGIPSERELRRFGVDMEGWILALKIALYTKGDETISGVQTAILNHFGNGITDWINGLFIVDSDDTK